MKPTSRVPQAMVVLSSLAIAFMVMGYAARTASAQVLYGSIVGTLTDETGAVIPKAAVTVLNTSTGLSRQTTANDAAITRFQTCPRVCTTCR